MYYKVYFMTLALLILLGCSKMKFLRSPEKSFDFTELIESEEYDRGLIFYGDTQKHHDIHADMVTKIMSFDPIAVFHLGDMVSEGDNKEDWDSFDIITKNLKQTAKFYPVIGNHEKGVKPKWYFNHWDFNIGSGYYSLYLNAQGNLSTESNRNNKVQIIVLHSNPGYFRKDEDQYNWLLNKLEQNSTIPKILIFHVPLYMAGTHHNEVGENHPAKELYKIIDSKKYNIIICISGHDRAYQNFVVDDVYHLVTGNSGETPNEQKVFNNKYLQHFNSTYNFTIMKLKEGSLSFTVFDIKLKIIDKFEIPLN